MKWHMLSLALASATALAIALTPTTASAQNYSDVRSNGNLHLKSYGNFFIPGTLASCPTPPPPATNSNICSGTTNPGLHMINQMYVQFMLPEDDQKDGFGKEDKDGHHHGHKHYPIANCARLLLEHKILADHARWTDGQWDEFFVRQGFDTYMIDQVGRARSGFDPTTTSRCGMALHPAFLAERSHVHKTRVSWLQQISSPGTCSAGASIRGRPRHAPPQTHLIQAFGFR